MILSVSIPGVIMVFMKYSTLVARLLASVTDIRCSVKPCTAFNLEILAGTVTCRAGRTLYPTEDYLVADIYSGTVVAVYTMVPLIAEIAFSRSVIGEPVFFLPL